MKKYAASLALTRFYPVDIEKRIIYLDAFPTKRDLERRYPLVGGEKFVIGIRGSRLMDKNRAYASYARTPVTTRESLIAEWEFEQQKALYLWKGAASEILATLREDPPEQALMNLTKCYREARAMAISAFYGRAVRDLKALLLQALQAKPVGGA